MDISADPAMGEYVPGAPVNDEVRKRNQNPTVHKPNRNSGNEMYLDRDIIIYVDPSHKDNGTAFRPSKDPNRPQSAESFFIPINHGREI